MGVGCGYNLGYGYSDGDGGYGCSYNYGNGYGSGGVSGCGDGYGYNCYVLFYTKPFMAYHCMPKNKYIRYMKKVKAEIGLVLEMDENPILCEKGFHASMKPEEARSYVPEGILTKVECSGKVIFGSDKLVCTKRKILEIYE